jgi:cell division protein FtsW
MYMAAGIGTSIFIYAVLHAGVVTGIFPTTGLPMPFISYGGSQLVTTLAGVGIILNISRQGKPSGELKS